MGELAPHLVTWQPEMYRVPGWKLRSQPEKEGSDPPGMPTLPACTAHAWALTLPILCPGWACCLEHPLLLTLTGGWTALVVEREI